MQVRQPSVPDGRLKHLPHRDDLVVQRAARWCLPRSRVSALCAIRDEPLGSLAIGGWRSRHAVNPVLLHFAGRHFGQAKLAEEGQEVKSKPSAVAFDPHGATLPLGDGLVFLEELFRRLGECLFGFLEETGARFAAQF